MFEVVVVALAQIVAWLGLLFLILWEYKKMQWLWNLLIALDQFTNVLTSPVLNIFIKPGGARFGNPDETLSSVFGKNRHRCRLCFYACLLLHLVDRNHCEKSIERDEG